MKIAYEGVNFFCSHGSSIEKSLVKHRLKKAVGIYKKDLYLTYAEEILSSIKDPIVVDIGANIGTTLLPLAKKFPQGTFIAVEPHPFPARRFMQNLDLNKLKNVSFVNGAIAPTLDLISLYSCPTNSGGHRVTGFQNRFPQNPISSISIPLKKLFTHFEIDFCHLLKIDVEGFEYQVLKSLEDGLCPKKISHIVAEYGPEGMRSAKTTGWELVNLLLERGYQCKELKSSKKITDPNDLPLLPDFSVTDFIFY